MKLKTYYAITFILLASVCNGQSYIFSQQDKTWYPEEFISGNFKKIEAYSYKISNRGKIKKKSTLLYRQEYNKDFNKVYGINHSTIYRSDGPTSLSFYNFEKNYNTRNELISSKSFNPPAKDNKDEKHLPSIEQRCIEHLYDDEGNMTLETHSSITGIYDMFSQDSVLLIKSVHPEQIYEHIYKDKLHMMSFKASDSTRTKNYFDNTIESNCSNCYPKYKYLEKRYYDNDNLELSTSYTRKGEFHTKSYYYYDSTNRLIKQIDSTGWYLAPYTKPYLESETDITYTGKGKILTKKNYDIDTALYNIIIKQYNKNNQLISDCTTDNSNIQHCIQYQYVFEGNKIRQIITTATDMPEITTSFKYNANGYLIEESVSAENKLIEVIRYFYE